ncbi:GntR family transcriptional regulator [Microbacterium sp. NPDC055683]
MTAELAARSHPATTDGFCRSHGHTATVASRGGSPEVSPMSATSVARNGTTMHTDRVTLVKSTLADAALTRIAHDILRGDPAPGARLHLDDISARLGVSRQPVREALMRLQRLHLVDVEPSRWSVVATPTELSISRAAELSVFADGAMLRLGMPSLSAGGRARVEDAAQRMIDAADEVARFAATRQLVAEAAAVVDNPLILAFWRDADLTIRHHLRAGLRGEGVDALGEAVAGQRADDAAAALAGLRPAGGDRGEPVPQIGTGLPAKSAKAPAGISA